MFFRIKWLCILKKIWLKCFLHCFDLENIIQYDIYYKNSALIMIMSRYHNIFKVIVIYIII